MGLLMPLTAAAAAAAAAVAALADDAMEGALLREPWLKARERVRTEIFADSDDISRVVAGEIAALIRRRQAEGACWVGSCAAAAGLRCIDSGRQAVHGRPTCHRTHALPRRRTRPLDACRAAVRAGAGHRQHPHARLPRAGPPAQAGGRGLKRWRPWQQRELAGAVRESRRGLPAEAQVERSGAGRPAAAAPPLPPRSAEAAPPRPPGPGREEGLSFANVRTFNLDEYHPMQPDALQVRLRSGRRAGRAERRPPPGRAAGMRACARVTGSGPSGTSPPQRLFDLVP